MLCRLCCISTGISWEIGWEIMGGVGRVEQPPVSFKHTHKSCFAGGIRKKLCKDDFLLITKFLHAWGLHLSFSDSLSCKAMHLKCE